MLDGLDSGLAGLSKGSCEDSGLRELFWGDRLILLLHRQAPGKKG